MRIILLSLLTLISFNLFAQSETAEIYKVVDDMPRFPGCDGEEMTKEEQKQCSEKNMLAFIYQNVQYPVEAQNNDIQGTVVIQFVVEKDGSIGTAKALKDIGGGCADEAIRVVNLMNELEQKWTPGKKEGVIERVYYTLPVKFKIKEAAKYYMEGRDSIYHVYDTPPTFEGGVEALEQHIDDHLKMPKMGEDSCLVGMIECNTLVRANQEVLVLETKDYHGLGWDFEYAATHAITSSMFKWTPAVFEGRNVSSAYLIRIPFTPKNEACAVVVKEYESAVTLHNEGILLYNEEKTEEAIAKWTEAIALAPHNTELYLHRGQAYLDLEKREEACVDLQLVKSKRVSNVYNNLLPYICAEKVEKVETTEDKEAEN